MGSPKYLYRFFKKKKFRDQFIQGFIRFGRIELYREIEDKERRDIDEARARGKYRTDKLIYLTYSNVTGKIIDKGLKSGDIFISGDSLNKFFIVCFSDELVDLNLSSKKLGRYIVRIDNPEELLDLLNKKCRFSWNVGRIVLVQVEYDKDKYIKMEENNPHLPIKYYYAQKSESFAHEHEWRIVLTGSAIKEIIRKYQTIKIGSIESIATAIDL